MKRTPAVLASTAVGFAAVLALSAGKSMPSAAGPARQPVAPATGTPGKGTQAGAPPSTAPPATSSGSATTATGNNEQYGYGIMSVKATVSGHRIVSVKIANLQTAESYSQQLAQQVIPMLKHEVLAAQSARVSTISGATYTSEAYLASLQSALDHLHVA